ncbi:androglobin-like isoform X2 [Dendroctonus ponderosae]|uniref:androglobin-like isoform X2 n=1 Tax=Dendroctonus ponderosae TaxID=77166 RepID=UPI0020356D8B|nr:androglobin-like isoform X2 [Dendroctonus ponderosae]
MSKQRSQKPKLDNTLVAEEPSLTTPISAGTDPDTLPFPEFTDQDINSEKWDNGTAVKDKSQIKSLFEDPQKVHLPSGISAHEWKRCSDVYSNVNFVVYSNSHEYPDLVTPNTHLLETEFYRHFVSVIETLLYIGSTKPFLQEYGSQAFYTSVEKAWKPWHHIYSNCKITKGEHSPVYNPVGKYVVRLFWMGTWRKIYVDDFLPMDQFNNVLLPTFQSPKVLLQEKTQNINVENKPTKTKPSKRSSPVRKETLQLWPMILCKALLKIASLSSCFSTIATNDFDIVNCLTGWIPQKIKTKDIPASDLWDIFIACVPRFEWAETKDGSTKKTGSPKSKTTGKDASKLTKKSVKAVVPVGVENMKDGDHYVMLNCCSRGEASKTNHVESSNMAKSSLIFLVQIRDIPLIQPAPRPEIEFWKTFRFEEWAVEQGILSPDIKKLNIQSLKIIDPIRRILPVTESAPKPEDIKFADKLVDDADKKSEKSSKSSKKSAKSSKSVRLEPEPCSWAGFMDFQQEIDHITIYFQPRLFKDKTKISDVNFPNTSQEFRHINAPITRKKMNNEPIYLFMDSIDYKFLLINLAQLGNVALLQKNTEEEDDIEDAMVSSEDVDICEEIVLIKTRRKDVSKTVIETDSSSSVQRMTCKSVSLVLEEYSWKSNSLGNAQAILRSYGTRSIMLDLKPGRMSFRLWISADCSYVLQLFSDSTVRVGCLEEYLQTCSAESQTLTNLCYELSSCYGKLVQSFGMPEHTICLRNFYQCYKPFQNLSKKELVIVHRIVFEELCKTIIENSLTSDALYAINLLFFNLKTFDYPNPYIEETHLCPDKFALMEQVEYAKIMQRAAVKIQAFFKSWYIRAMLKKTSQTHKEYFGVFDTLKKTYVDIFASEKRLVYCPTLLRRVFEHPEMSSINQKFDIFSDTESVLSLRVFTGSINVQECVWVPLCRYEFQIEARDPVFVKMHLFCNLNQYCIRVFNNDNLTEIKREINRVAVCKYPANEKGYTVLGYGWSEHEAKANWKLVLATQTMAKNNLIVNPQSFMATSVLKDNYIPNYKSVICRCIVKVGSDAFVTANLTTSFDDVKICLKLIDKNGKRLLEKNGTKTVLLPMMNLQTDTVVSEPSVKQLVEDQNRRIESVSEVSEISYRKGLKSSGLVDTESNKSASIFSAQKHSLTDGTKRHKKKFSEVGDMDDEISYTSQRSSDARFNGRKSHNKLGSRASVSSKIKSKLIVPTRSIDFPQTQYILEATVVEGSWPLTADEWDRVQKLRQLSYLDILDERPFLNKKPSTPKKSASIILEEPFWTLDLVYSSNSVLEFEQDHSESEKLKQLKSKWFSDIERYKNGLECRKKYIEEHSVFKSDFSIDKSKRSNNWRDFASFVIVGDSLDQYMVKSLAEVDWAFCKTKSPDDYIIEESNIERRVKEYEKEEEAIQEDIECKIQEQQEQFEIIANWFADIKEESMEMINDALAMKQKYVEKFLSQHKKHDDKKQKGKKKK